MEAIGFVASVGQISAYAFNILETMQKIRALAHDGPDQLQEKVQQLDILLMVVCRIEGNQNLRDDAIARYLASIQKKIRRLLETVHLNLSKLGARTFKGLLAAIRIISTEKLFDASFTAISQDCNTLALHIMSSPNENKTKTIPRPPAEPKRLSGPGQSRSLVVAENNSLLVTQRRQNPRVPEVHHQDYSHRSNDDDDNYTTTSGQGKAGRSEDATPRAMPPYIDQIFGNISSSGRSEM